jgi:hypothetical protein
MLFSAVNIKRNMFTIKVSVIKVNNDFYRRFYHRFSAKSPFVKMSVRQNVFRQSVFRQLCPATANDVNYDTLERVERIVLPSMRLKG